MLNLPNPQKLIKKLLNVDALKEDEDFRTFVLVAYLSARRINEILAVSPENFYVKQDVLFCTFRILKKKSDVGPKNIPLASIVGQSYEAVAARNILEYVNKRKEAHFIKVFQKAERTYRWKLANIKLTGLRLFKDGQVFEGNIKLYPHFFRHLRATQLGKKMGLGLKGWLQVHVRTLERYVHYDPEEFVDFFAKSKEDADEDAKLEPVLDAE